MSGDEGASVTLAYGQGASAPRVAAPPTDEEILLHTPLASMLDALPDAVLIYTADGRILRANSVARDMFSLDSRPNFATLPLEERLAAIAPRNLDGTQVSLENWHVARILRGETITGEHATEARIRSLDGQERVFGFTGAPIRNDEGEVIGAITIVREISERWWGEKEKAQALARLQQRDAQLQRQAAMLERTHEAIFLWELGGPIIYWNRGAELLYGYTAAEAVGRRSHELLQTVHPMGFADFETFLRGVGEWTGELQHMTRDGRQADVLSRHQALHETDGKLYVLETSRDITERKQMERELSQRAAELESANRQMDEFLSIVGHELRTPLASIKPNLQLAERQIRRLTEQLEASAPQPGGQDSLGSLRTLVDRSLRQVNRMTRLVNDLTDASRIRSDRLELQLTLSDLGDIVRECIEEQRQATMGRVIQLDLPEASVPVEVDGLRIGQVVTNYLTNALRYTPPDQPITVSVRAKDGQARVAVRDRGPGISTEEQAHIWQRFYRVPGVQHQSESGVGLGLGLFISKSLVVRHDGRIGVESKPGQGATFWFTLPLAE